MHASLGPEISDERKHCTDAVVAASVQQHLGAYFFQASAWISESSRQASRAAWLAIQFERKV